MEEEGSAEATEENARRSRFNVNGTLLSNESLGSLFEFKRSLFFPCLEGGVGVVPKNLSGLGPPPLED